jgi:hypothetical protein
LWLFSLGCGVSASEYSYMHITWYGAQINFGDLPPYLTYVGKVLRNKSNIISVFSVFYRYCNSVWQWKILRDNSFILIGTGNPWLKGACEQPWKDICFNAAVLHENSKCKNCIIFMFLCQKTFLRIVLTVVGIQHSISKRSSLFIKI